MKKVIFGILFLGLIGLGIVGCKKDVNSVLENNEIQNSKELSNSHENEAKADWLNISITFEPIRIHRATTDRPRDGKNCGCNECFGICNAPALGDGERNASLIGVEFLQDGFATIYFLDKKPYNFENEFGIDEEVKVKLTTGETVSLLPGEYSAEYEEGKVRDLKTRKPYIYFGKVNVRIKI